MEERILVLAFGLHHETLDTLHEDLEIPERSGQSTDEAAVGAHSVVDCRSIASTRPALASSARTKSTANAVSRAATAPHARQ